HPEEKGSLDAPAKLTRAKLNKRSRDADLSKDMLGPESPPISIIQLGDEGLSFGGEGSDSVAIPFPLSALGVVIDDPLALVIRIALEEGVTSGIGTLVIIVVVVIGVGIVVGCSALPKGVDDEKPLKA
ncbi:hypothetical protein Tco_1452743, partial [Tanacetum coccineum]